MNKEIIKRIKTLELINEHEIEDLRPIFTHIFGYDWAVEKYGVKETAEIVLLCKEHNLSVDGAM